MVGQAVGQVGHFGYLGGQSAQRLHKAGIAVDFDVQVAQDAVVRGAVLVEVLVFFLDFFESEAEVKGVFLFLRIELQREGIALLHEVHHLLVLHFIIVRDFVFGDGHLLIFVMKFRAQ